MQRPKKRSSTRHALAARKFRGDLPAGQRLREATPLSGTFAPIRGPITDDALTRASKAVAGLAARCSCGALVFAEFFRAGLCPACALERKEVSSD